MFVCVGGRVHGGCAGAEGVRGGDPQHRQHAAAARRAHAAAQRARLLRLPRLRRRPEQRTQSVSNIGILNTLILKKIYIIHLFVATTPKYCEYILSELIATIQQ